MMSWLIKYLCWDEDRECILDNLNEEYENHVRTNGRLAARWWYRLHVIRSVAPFILFHLKWREDQVRYTLALY